MKTELVPLEAVLCGDWAFVCDSCGQPSYQDEPLRDDVNDLVGVRCDWCGHSEMQAQEEIELYHVLSPVAPICEDHGVKHYNSNTEEWVCVFC